MTRLHELQCELQAYLLGASNAAAGHVAEAGNLDATARLQIYADAYRLRLREALESDYPALRAWLGPERFTEAAERYLAAHPSTHYSLRCFGQHLPGFLVEARLYKDTTLLGELALFEWALGAAFDAADEPILTRDALAGIAPADWPGLRLETHPSVVRLDLAWNAPAMRQAVDAAKEPLPAPIRTEQKVFWLIWRQDYQTRFRSLEADEARAFDVLRAGARFADLCEELARATGAETAPARAAAMLERWVADDLLRGCL